MNNWQERISECELAARNLQRYRFLERDLQREGALPTTHLRNWSDRHFAMLKEACVLDKSLFGRNIGFWTVEIEPHRGRWAIERKYRFWLTPLRGRCFWCHGIKTGLRDRLLQWGRYQFKTLLCRECSPSTERVTATIVEGALIISRKET